MTRAVVFDLDGVLLDGWHTRAEKRRAWNETLERDLGLDQKSLEKYFFSNKGLFTTEVLGGQRTLHNALEEILPLCGGGCDAQTFIDYWLPRDAHVRQDLLKVIEQLKETGKVRLYIATNNEKTRMDYMWHAVGLKNYFDDAFYAGDFKVLKPDPLFFEKCNDHMEKTDLPPLFFDDSPAYCEGARACGWEAVVYNDLSDCLAHPFIAAVLGREREAQKAS